MSTQATPRAPHRGSRTRLEEEPSELADLYRTAPVGLCLLDRDLRYLRINERLAAANGKPVADHLGRRLREVIPGVAARLEPVLQEVIETGEPVLDFEYESNRPTRKCWLASCLPVWGADGEVQGVTSLVQDITERRRAEEALRASERQLRELAGRLISAQEEERRRLARELHDDLSQRLAVLAIEAGKLEQEMVASSEADRLRMARMRQQLTNVSCEVHAISRQLHPSILDDLGLASAIESECKSFGRREQIAVEYEQGDIPFALPGEIALGLYRIAQEGLRNVARHARTDETRVSLRWAAGKLVLCVEDRGIGFEPARGRGGLGLASMEERARLIHGDLTVRSKPGRGTLVRVEVPVPQGGGPR